MPPSNAGYYEAAYVIAAVVYVLYGVTLAARRRALRRQLEADSRDAGGA